MATPQTKAAKQARQIERRGDTVTMADGVTTIKAIFATRPDETRAAASQDIIDSAGTSTLGLIYLTAQGYRTYMQNERQTLTRGTEKWTIAGIPRNESFSDTSLVYVLLAYTGGNPA